MHPLMAHQMSLFRLSVMEIYNTEHDNVEMYDLPMDLKKAIEGYVDAEIKDQEDNLEDLMRERSILANLNLIGIAGYNEFVSLIAEMTEGNIQDIDNYIHRKFLLSSNIIDEGDGILIIKSPFLGDDDIEDIFEMMDEHESDCEYTMPFEEMLE